LTQKEFVEKIGVSLGAVQLWESKDKYPNGEILTRMMEEFGVNLNWLMTGYGHKYVRESDFKDTEIKKITEGRQITADKAEAPDAIDIGDDIKLAIGVLTSGSPYATALHLNIRSFANAIADRERINNLESTMARFQARLDGLEAENKKLRNEIQDLKDADGCCEPPNLNTAHGHTGTDESTA
jgi:transcriptional regulator with XRE-family HTH domain